MSIRNIERLTRVVTHNLCRMNGSFSYNYPRMTEAIMTLCSEIVGTETDESTWSIGRDIPLGEVIVGAYWHYTKWHGGQASMTYAALCALGQIFDPGMSGPEKDNEVYRELGIMAQIKDIQDEK